jgi:hypothetical protein
MSTDLSNNPTQTLSGSVSSRLAPERITQLAECLIAGRTRAETAEILGVSVRTVSRWRKASVLDEVKRLRGRTHETRAIDVLQRLLESDDERIALGAAQELLRRAAGIRGI